MLAHVFWILAVSNLQHLLSSREGGHELQHRRCGVLLVTELQGHVIGCLILYVKRNYTHVGTIGMANQHNSQHSSEH